MEFFDLAGVDFAPEVFAIEDKLSPGLTLYRDPSGIFNTVSGLIKLGLLPIFCLLRLYISRQLSAISSVSSTMAAVSSSLQKPPSLGVGIPLYFF